MSKKKLVYEEFSKQMMRLSIVAIVCITLLALMEMYITGEPSVETFTLIKWVVSAIFGGNSLGTIGYFISQSASERSPNYRHPEERQITGI